MVGPLILFQYLGYITPEMLYDKAISGQKMRINIIVIFLLKAIIQTSLTEEIFFRFHQRLWDRFYVLKWNYGERKNLIF
ncbi:hypothetical protein [Proteiniborus sp. DW1]|uniref:hypothetical protein n=1 Tax=Proteiniborus sp. DW1 TaxID=1889883 RepID=UPI000ADF73A8|nr:hypothetical protein [Proteiniborus sp. DW1]